ncbi:MAG: hypothetical protein P0Y49_21965 [Candidatus Pedobacter colombiensis]|uniref:Uncharacterized protein n=1 Tax=Candidatus Pedobacter colombiensis TaxID=3121371 RepID=A0AAJ6B720_9SPHI|nr:hypothetical protein [Pedobacter sp.]WEK19444.1 MAG: hypothetical protein P0Y49_21965 [Pedobacter sp.]
MSITFFNPDLSQARFNVKDVLSSFRKQPLEKDQIRGDMTSEEISEVVSDRIITVIKEQFEVAKKNFEAKEEM